MTLNCEKKIEMQRSGGFFLKKLKFDQKSDGFFSYRVTAAANLKNVVLRKARLKIRVLISLL